MTYHSPLSASSMERWMNCPGSYNLIASMPKGVAAKTSKHAVKGTLMHEIAAGIKYNLPSILMDGHEVEITEEMKENVRDYDLFCSRYSNDATCVFAARELSFSIPYIHQHFNSTIDFIAVNGDTLHIVDLKTGNKKVEVEDNLQLQYYALGAFYWLRDRAVIGNQGEPYETPEMEILTRRTGNSRPIIKWVLLSIFQTNSSGTEIRTVRLPITRIIFTFKEIMLQAMRNAEGDINTFRENKSCFFCPAFRICPIQQKKHEPQFPIWKGELK